AGGGPGHCGPARRSHGPGRLGRVVALARRQAVADRHRNVEGPGDAGGTRAAAIGARTCSPAGSVGRRKAHPAGGARADRGAARAPVKGTSGMERKTEYNIWYWVVAFIAVLFIQNLIAGWQSVAPISYSQF